MNPENKNKINSLLPANSAALSASNKSTDLERQANLFTNPYCNMVSDIQQNCLNNQSLSASTLAEMDGLVWAAMPADVKSIYEFLAEEKQADNRKQNEEEEKEKAGQKSENELK